MNDTALVFCIWECRTDSPFLGVPEGKQKSRNGKDGPKDGEPERNSEKSFPAGKRSNPRRREEKRERIAYLEALFRSVGDIFPPLDSL